MGIQTGNYVDRVVELEKRGKRGIMTRHILKAPPLEQTFFAREVKESQDSVVTGVNNSDLEAPIGKLTGFAHDSSTCGKQSQCLSGISNS